MYFIRYQNNTIFKSFFQDENNFQSNRNITKMIRFIFIIRGGITLKIDSIAAGRRIKKIRKQHNYTMLQFAKMLGFSSPSTVNNWEKGNNLPLDERLDKIALLGNTTVAWIKYGNFSNYVRKLLQDAYSQSESFQLNSAVFKQLLYSLEKQQLSYHDDLQILTIAKSDYPELFEKNRLLQEYMVGEETYTYSVEKNKFYRKTVLPQIEEIFTTKENQTLNIEAFLRLFDLLNTTKIKDHAHLKIIHDLIDCFTFLITLEAKGTQPAESNSHKTVNEDSTKVSSNSEFLKSKNQLISLIDSFHTRYHF